MSSNSIGKNVVLTSFGESHGSMVGAVLDGFPSGFQINLDALQLQLSRRRPGQSIYTTSRQEQDLVTIVSGVFEGKTLGTPITFLIPNNDSKPSDYDALKDTYRPGHADALWDLKMGFRDHRGGGRSSARITAAWVAAGALAEQFLAAYKTGPIKITAWVSQVHSIKSTVSQIPSREIIDISPVRCPDPIASQAITQAIESAKQEGDSLGGVIQVSIEGIPPGTGSPVFRKLNAQLSHYLMNLNAVKGIYIGEDTLSHERKGSENNDSWVQKADRIGTVTNHSGGIVGGMATGEPISISVFFKPTSTIALEQRTIDSQGQSTTIKAEGRHDPCVLPRAVPIVEALSALAIMDLLFDF